MAQNIIYSPAVPYVGSIPGVVAPGFTVIIKGTAHPSCARFGINLQCGSNISPRDDVLLHIGVDFIRGCVIRNSIHSNNWGPEETQQGHFPFIRGGQFSVTIVCETSHYNIAINGQHFASFEHRIVYHRASHLTIDGDAILETIEYRSGSQSGFYPAAPGVAPHIQPGYPSAPTSVPYPTTPAMPAPTAVPGQYPPYPAPSTPYGPTPLAGMMGTTYGGAQPYLPHSPHHGTPGVHHASTHGHGHGHGHNKGVVGGLLNKIGAGGIAATAATAATAGLGYVGGKKAWKAQKKARKKALKFGIPLAGAGLGAYALSKAWSSSSSSSSSDEE